MLRYIEPWDVSDDDQVFDSTGCEVRLSGGAITRRRFWVGGGETVLNPDRSGDPRSAELAAILRQYANGVGFERLGISDADPSRISLAELVAAVHRRTRTR